MSQTKKKSKFALNKSLSMNEDLNLFNSSFSSRINEEEEYDSDEQPKKEVKREIGVFEEFKIKYDELRKENMEKRNEIDELKRVNKRLQIQLLNINTQFYDKEIKRLRLQVQKYQQQSQDYKFKYFQVQNKCNQLSSSHNIKQNQLKKLVKQLQAQKILTAELKHQAKQSEKQYLSIIATVEESGNKMAEKYGQSQNKLNSSENQLKRLKRDIQTERKNVEKLEKEGQLKQAQIKKLTQKHKIELLNAKKLYEEADIQAKQYRAQISNLKQKVQDLALQLTRNKSLVQFQTTKSFEKINQFRSTRLLQIQNKRMKEENQSLKRELQLKANSIIKSENLLDSLKQEIQLLKKQHERKVQEVQNKKSAIQKHYETKNLNLMKQIELLKIKCIKSESLELNSNKNNKQSSLNEKSWPTNQYQAFNSEFQQILSRKQGQIAQLKRTLGQKIEQNFKLKQQIEDINLQRQNLKNQLNIVQKKIAVQEKNITAHSQIQLLELNGEIECLKRKLQKSQCKTQIKIKQIKEKDAFILNYIVGKVSNQSELPLILAQLQRIFEGDYLQKLIDAQKKIKTLESKILAS